MERRELLVRALAGLVGLTVLPQASAIVIEDELKPSTASWLKGLHALCTDLKRNHLSPYDWQVQIEELYKNVSTEDLIALIDFHHLVKGLQHNDRGATFKSFRFPKLAGTNPRHLAGSKIFALKRGRAVIPHAHNHMVSSHLVLSGSFRVRTWQRRFDMEGEPGRLFLEPSLDRIMHPGEVLTMSDERDNIHWLTPETDIAYTLDIPVSGLYQKKTYVTDANDYGLIFVDPRGKPNGKGIVAAPILDIEKALEIFG